MAKLKINSKPLVYSTDHDRTCPDCGKPLTGCLCHKKKTVPAGDGIVRVGRETKGRKGKGVTVISGVPLNAPDLTRLAKELKSRCGSGGTVKNGIIELQGDHRETIIPELVKRGWRVKRCGG